MSMRIKQARFILPVLAAAIIAACSGGADLAGIGGSGFISTGTVTSFGSVFVNGVEFETTSSTFEVEDTIGSQQDLRIGMVVQVSGSINPDGVTGTATHINYGDDLEGPVSNIVTSVGIRSFTVFGITVEISEADTAFEGVGFSSIANGNVLEISGYYDQNDKLQASYVELKAVDSNAFSVFEIKGKISGLNVNSFQLQRVNIDASAANFNDLPNGLQNGQLVEVKGRFSNNTINAMEVKGVDSLDEDAEVEIEGLITRYVSNSDFDVNGQAVNASNANFSPSGLSTTLKAGMKLEVEGNVSNGILIATKIEIRGGSAGVSAKVATIDQANNRFSVEVISGQPEVVVQLTTATLLEDKLGNDDNLLLSELRVGDFVEVRGFESAVDTITATRVKREGLKDTELQGVVTADTATSFTVLGVTYTVDLSTSYDGAGNKASFMALPGYMLDQAVISIMDNNDPADGIADEIELED